MRLAILALTAQITVSEKGVMTANLNVSAPEARQ
jgi:hypothetical protein